MFQKKKTEIGITTIKTYSLFNIPIFTKIKSGFEKWTQFRLFGIPVHDSYGPRAKGLTENFVPSRNVVGQGKEKPSARISVVIGGGYDAGFIDTLNSIVKQSYRGFEIVLPVSKKPQTEQRLSEHDIPAIYYEGESIFDGVKAATGQYVAFCESGDTYLQDNLSSRAKALAKYEYPALIYNDAEVLGKGLYQDLLAAEIEKDRKLLNKRVNRIPDDGWRKRNCLCLLSSCLIKRDILLSCNLDSPNELLSDWWVLRQVCAHIDVVMLPEKLLTLTVTEKRIRKFNLHQLHKESFVSQADRLVLNRQSRDLVFDEKCVQVTRTVGTVAVKTGRMAVFASFNAKGVIDDFVVYYLRELKKAVDGIVFVCDNPVFPKELEKVEPYVFHIDCHRHGKYDFGSYGIGIHYLQTSHLLSSVNELVLCNDSCYGPLFPFQSLFDGMAARKGKRDFWGISRREVIKDHIQSFFLVFKKAIVSDPEFRKFFFSIKQHTDVSDVILNYEIELTDFLKKKGYVYDSVVSFSLTGKRSLKYDYVSLGVPLVKRKALDGTYDPDKRKISKLLQQIRENNMELYSVIKEK